jgi:adenosylhomocysteine nucleosidase
MIAIVFALEFESAVFAAKQTRQLLVSTWQLGAMGAGTAEVLAKKLAQTRPHLIVSAGFAGGLQPGLKVGDLVLGVNYSDAAIASRLVLSPRWQRGNLLTADAIVEKGENKRKLGEESGCLVADLETAHLARVCAEHNIPMVSVRCVSDAVEDDMPVPASVLLNPETGRPDSLGLFRHLITNPACVVGFNKLLKNAKTAQNGIADGLAEILPQLLRLA